MHKNRRKHKRLTWNRKGEIISLLGQQIAICFVKDISESGARIEISGLDKFFKLPDCFRLNYGADEQPKCSIRWRNGNEIGVEFLLRPRRVAKI